MNKKTVEAFEEINGVSGLRRGDVISAMIPLDKLIPTEWNPNTMSDAAQAMLDETIKDNGFLSPLSVVPLVGGTFSINSGEHRWKSAKNLGLKELPCEIMCDPKWQDEELQQFQSVKFNVVHGEMNPDKMVSLYNKVALKHGPEKVAALMGYTQKNGLEKIIKQVSAQIKDTLPAEMVEKFEKEAKEAKTVHDLNKIIQHIFDDNGDALNYNFLVFSFGGKEHTYIAANKTVNQAIKKIIAISKDKHLDVNEMIEEALMGVANGYGDPSGF